MKKVVDIESKRKEKKGIVPTKVIIMNKSGKRRIKKRVTIPFIPTNGTMIVFAAEIQGKMMAQLAYVDMCSYCTVTETMDVWLFADDAVIDNLLESGGFTVDRH
jgi:hypothetical protein